MHQEITPEAKADFVARLKEGKGLVVLQPRHRELPGVAGYTAIIGAHYYLRRPTSTAWEKPRQPGRKGMHFPYSRRRPAASGDKGGERFSIRTMRPTKVVRRGGETFIRC